MGLLQEVNWAQTKAQDPACPQGSPCPLIAVRLDHSKQFFAEGHVPEAAEVLLVDQGRAEAMMQSSQHKRVAGAPQQDALEDMILSHANGRHEVVRRARSRQGCGIPAVEVGRVGDQRGIRFELGHYAFLDALEWLKEGRLDVEVEVKLVTEALPLSRPWRW